VGKRIVSLPSAIGLEPPEMVAFTGGGGKTSLMMALAGQLAAGVVMTATTRLSLSQTRQTPEVVWLDAATVVESGRSIARGESFTLAADLANDISLSLARTGVCLVVGEQVGDKVSGVPVELPGGLLSLGDVAYVLVEADGSRNRPCKAPDTHEPVIPAESTVVMPMAGIEAIGKPIAEISHRPELVSSLVEQGTEEILTPQTLATLLMHPNGGMKGIPEGARVVPFINKVEDFELLACARQVARIVLEEERVEKVILGAVQSKRPVREIHSRVRAVILAAGESSRMGRTKQLLPWGNTTVLGQTIKNLQGSKIDDIVVVTGFQREAVAAEAARFGVASIYNAEHAQGGMISSLQVALKSLPDNRSAVLVMLADQPMIDSEIVDRLIRAYWENQGQLIAPLYDDRRGNPVLFGRPYFDELLSITDGSPPRQILRRHKEELTLVEVDSTSVLRDLDREEDYVRWRPDT
jgi:molybdenum cofactor cytidylyltransferase